MKIKQFIPLVILVLATPACGVDRPIHLTEADNGRTNSVNAGCDFLRISLPRTAPDKHISVVVVNVEGAIRVDQNILPQSSGVITLPFYLAGVHNPPDVGFRCDLHPIRV